jgi:hypothetical protein
MLPDNTLQATGDNGLAFVFGAAPGALTLTATKDAVTFKPTTLKVHDGAFNTTVVTE